MLRGAGRQPTTMLPTPAGDLYAHLVVNLDGRRLHEGVHRVERAKEEAR
jgi:hypothetical protein